MGFVMEIVLVAVFAYLLGSIPWGLVLGKGLWGVDVRNYGSHNIGATNVWRTLGKGPGALVFLLDFLKGLVSVYLAGAWTGEPLAMVIAAAFAIIGHSASIFLGFRGGKGVATGLGAIAMLMPLVTLLIFLVWLLLVWRTGYVSLGSIVAAACTPIFALIGGEPWEYILFALLAAVVIIVRHHANIQRLRAGTEAKIHAGHQPTSHF